MEEVGKEKEAPKFSLDIVTKRVGIFTLYSYLSIYSDMFQDCNLCASWTWDPHLSSYSKISSNLSPSYTIPDELDLGNTKESFIHHRYCRCHSPVHHPPPPARLDFRDQSCPVHLLSSYM